jgi:hypothetical protein
LRADQRDPLRQLEWMEPRAMPGAIFRGAHMSSLDNNALPVTSGAICITCYWQQCWDNRSRMTRDRRVRIRGGLGGKFQDDTGILGSAKESRCSAQLSS